METSMNVTKASIGTEIIERLRASKKKSDEKAYHLGHEAGENFAKNRAEADDLERLEDYCEKMNSSFCGVGRWWGEAPESSSDSAEELLFFAIRPDSEGYDDDAANFWSEVTDGHGHLAGKTRFLQGFVDGALDVWDQVQAEL